MSLPVWLLPNVLSLDAPMIAVLWQGFFASIFHVPISPAARVSLALTVWAIYIADRLLDVRSASSELQTARHLFHRAHGAAMSRLLAVVALCACGVAVWDVAPVVFRAGAGLAGAVAVYLYAVHRGYLSSGKEFAVAVLFGAGTVLAPLTRSEQKGPILVAGAAFFVSCLANTTSIQAAESSARTRPPLWPLAFLAFAAFYSHPGARHAIAAAAISVCAIATLFWRRRSVSPDAFRVLADAAMLTPIPVWLAWPA